MSRNRYLPLYLGQAIGQARSLKPQVEYEEACQCDTVPEGTVLLQPTTPWTIVCGLVWNHFTSCTSSRDCRHLTTFCFYRSASGPLRKAIPMSCKLGMFLLKPLEMGFRRSIMTLRRSLPQQILTICHPHR